MSDISKGVSIGIAAAAMSRTDGARPSFGQRLVEEGGEAAKIGERWLEAEAMIAEGNDLDGWLAKRESKQKAERLYQEAARIKDACEAAYRDLTET